MNRLERRFPALMMARRNLSRSKMRSALAALGIVIGVVAIASLGLFGSALQVSATQSLGDIGSDLVVSPAFSEGVQSLDDRDVRQIRRAARDAGVVPIKQSQGVVSYGEERTVTTIYGIENPGTAWVASDGRVPDQLRSGALVGSSVADRLDLTTGNTVTVGGQSYRVVGVIESQGGFSPVNPNSAVVVPPSAVDVDGYTQVLVTASSGAAANQTATEIRDSLNRREQRVTVFELSSITDQIGSLFDVINTFLLAIGSISLVVAGVSILNVMLMSTVERREEIGVLRAVGFQKRQVLRILLAEAVALGAAGGLIGILLSTGAGALIYWQTLGDPLGVFTLQNIGYLALAYGFALVTSTLSGLYPAWKAANRPPVEALRS